MVIKKRKKRVVRSKTRRNKRIGERDVEIKKVKLKNERIKKK